MTLNSDTMRFPHKKTILGIVKSPKITRLIHVALLTHLLMIGTLVALIVGASTYYLRSKEIADGVLATVRHETEILRAHIERFATERRLTFTQAAKAVLGEAPPADLLELKGRFLSVEICAPDGTATPLWGDPKRLGPAGDRCITRDKESMRSAGSSSHDIVRHEGQLYVLTRTSISTLPGLDEGEAHTTVLLSDSTRKELESAATERATLAAIIVLLTTLTIYPAMLLLVRRIGKLTENLLQSNLEMIQVLGSAIAKRDTDTDEHNYRVSLYSARLAEALNLGQNEMRGLLKGAFLHDIGKIGIPDHILRKPGPLSSEETEVMRSHVPLGLDIVLRSNWLAEAAEVVGCHHERVNGTGYPKGISGEEIPLSARIFAIADVFDALCSERPYKHALSADEAIAIMRRESGGRFDQSIFNTFESVAVDLHARYAACEPGDL
ncbi:MAG: HD-GYP domain-containing protein, partial [Propionivibrio sp.]